MNAETLKDFLISLGFKVDDAGARKFDAIVTGATLKAIELGAKVELAAASVVAFTAKVASGLDNLYWASQRTGATVEGIKRIGFAVSQMGGSVDAARGSLESLAQFIRTSPGAEGFLNRLGVQTRDASGNMRDMASIFTGVGQRLSSMPYYRANQYAQMLGMDENTLLAMRRGIGEYMGQYNAMKKAIGFNPDQAAAASNRFMTSLRSFGEMAGMARDKIGSNLAGGLAGAIDNLRRQILDNFPKIERTINAVVKGILWMGEAVGRVVYRLIQAAGDIRDWWKGLNDDTKVLIETLGGLLVAWRLLNAAMLASPITWVLALAGALLLLYDDYKTWKEGGKSLIDWDKWEPAINFALTAIEKLWTGVKRLKDELIKLFGIDPKTWSIKFEFDSLKKQFNELSKMLDTIGKLLNAIDEGRWSDAAGYARQLLNQGGEPVAPNAVTDSASSAADWTKQNLGFDPRIIGQTVKGWLFGDEPDQHAQAVKRGERNNNPGNLNFAGQHGASLERPGGRFARFETAYDGLRAIARQLMLYAGRGLNTVEKIITTWAPPSDGNNTPAYIAAVSRQLGVNPRAVLNVSDPQTMSALVNSIVHHENGRNIYSRELINNAAMAGIGRKGATLHQETNIHVHGVSNPREAANLVVERQNAVNNRATQDLAGGN